MLALYTQYFPLTPMCVSTVHALSTFLSSVKIGKKTSRTKIAGKVEKTKTKKSAHINNSVNLWGYKTFWTRGDSSLTR